MKRIGTIIMSIVLALAIIYLGGGTVRTLCLRSNTVTYGTKHCCPPDSKQCPGDKQCMISTLVQLQPTVVVDNLCKIQAPVIDLFPMILGDNINECLQYNTDDVSLMAYHSPHAPPRRYLSIIRILII